MDFSIKDLGSTLAIGAFALCGFLLVRDRLEGTTFLARLTTKEDSRPMGWIILLLVASYALGMILEVGSDYVVGPFADEARLVDRAWIRTEEDLKVDVVVDRSEGKLTPLGEELARRKLFGKYCAPAGNELDATLLKPPICMMDQRLIHAIKTLYYHARNHVLRKDTYFEELRAIQERVDFLRSFALTCTLLALVTVWIRFALRPQRHGHMSERSKGLVQVLMVLLVALFFSLRGYWHEEEQFNKRVFGYYIDLVDDGKG